MKEELKMYMLYDGGYSEQYFTVARSVDEAISSIKNYCELEDEKNKGSSGNGYYMRHFDNLLRNLEDNLEVFERGEVYQTEVA